jgi:hypothetical protein
LDQNQQATGTPRPSLGFEMTSPALIRSYGVTRKEIFTPFFTAATGTKDRVATQGGTLFRMMVCTGG